MSLKDVIFSYSFVFLIVRMTTPILFAALGGLISRRAGILNLTLEGTMLTSALIGVVFSAWARSAALDGIAEGAEGYEAALASATLWGNVAGLTAAIVAGILVALLLGLMSIKLRANITLAGIAINLFASGFTPFLCQVVAGNKANSSALFSTSLPVVDIPLIKDIPILGDILSGHYLLTYVAIISIFVVNFLMYKTATGLRIRAVGENPHAAESVGINVNNIQIKAMVLSGFFCALGGAFMSMSYLSFFVKNTTSGRGFVALAAMNLGNAEPVGTTIASVVFGAFDALAVNLRTVDFPTEFISMIPYVATLLGLVVFAVNQDRKLKKIRSKR